MISIRTILALSAAMMASLVLADVARADKVDDPTYKAWASFKPGSSETLEGTEVYEKTKLDLVTTYTLKEVTDDHVSIEIVTVATFTNGVTHITKPTTSVIPAKSEPKDIKDLGKEDVKAMGKVFKCEAWDVTNDASAVAGSKATGGPISSQSTKVWLQSDVPGSIVKMEIKAKHDKGDDTTIEFILKSMNVKPAH